MESPLLSTKSCRAEASQTTITAGIENTQHNRKRIAKPVNMAKTQSFWGVRSLPSPPIF